MCYHLAHNFSKLCHSSIRLRYNGAHRCRMREIFIFLRMCCRNKQKRSTTISFRTVCQFPMSIFHSNRYVSKGFSTKQTMRNGKSKSNAEHVRSRQREFLRLYLIKRASCRLLRENEKFRRTNRGNETQQRVWWEDFGWRDVTLTLRVIQKRLTTNELSPISEFMQIRICMNITMKREAWRNSIYIFYIFLYLICILFCSFLYLQILHECTEIRSYKYLF